jgi:hypothetical protein
MTSMVEHGARRSVADLVAPMAEALAAALGLERGPLLNEADLAQVIGPG